MMHDTKYKSDAQQRRELKSRGYVPNNNVWLKIFPLPNGDDLVIVVQYITCMTKSENPTTTANIGNYMGWGSLHKQHGYKHGHIKVSEVYYHDDIETLEKAVMASVACYGKWLSDIAGGLIDYTLKTSEQK